MEVFEKSETIDPEVRAYVYSLVSAVSQYQTPTSSNRLTDAPRSVEAVRSKMVAMFWETMLWHV